MKMIIILTGVRRTCVAGVMLCFLFASNAHAIKKCQDAEGKWHYGDGAAKECDTAKVTELNNRGFVKGEEEAPKTKEQIEAERETVEKLEEMRLAQQKEKEERERILSVYQSESDIDRQLDNQIYSVDSSITVHQVYLKGMAEKIARLEKQQPDLKGFRKQANLEEIETSKAKIAEFETELKSLENQKKEIQERFAREKELYRALQEEAAAATSS